MCNEIYPDGGRVNNLSSVYCEIAMESYYRAANFYRNIQDANFSWDKCAEENQLMKMVISTVVFSAMCLESFFNDYIAAVLGDDSLYNTYDVLSPQSKFCFISEFIFKQRVDKSKSYYMGIKVLAKYRDGYVHNKSSRFKLQQFTSQQCSPLEEMFTEHEAEILEPPLLDKKEIDAELRKALEALKTIRDVARYFDEYDASCYAMIKLFGEKNYFFRSSYEQKYMEKVFKELGIKKK